MKYPIIYFAIIIIIYGQFVLASPLSLNNSLTNKISKLHIRNYFKHNCAMGIIKQEVPCGSFFTLIHRNHHGDLLIQQLSANDCYSFIVRSPQSQNWLLRSRAYIVLLKNITEFAAVFDKLSKDFAWTPTAKFFIILHLKNEEYLEVFTILSKLNIYHVHLISTVPTDEIYVYTYNPFLNNSCGHVNKEVVKTFSCREIKRNEIHSNEIENQIRNCPITVMAMENPPNVIFKSNKNFLYHGISPTGIEQYMLNNIAKSENFKLQYIHAQRQNKYAFVLDNCTSTSALGYLANHSLAISIGGYVLMRKGSVCYDFIWGYSYANFNVYTSFRVEENWRKVYQAFGTTTWALIAVSYCAVTCISITIYNMLVGKKNNKYLALKIWGYLNSHTDQQLIKIRKLRIIMITWIWFTFFIINFYNTAFYGLLTARDKKGLTVKPNKLYTLSLKPCISLKIRAWFKFTYNLTLSSQIQDECLYDDTALEAVAENEELYTLVSEPTYYKREYKYLDKFGHPKLERWFLGTGDFVFSIFANRGFPLIDKFQRYALYHFESGLLLKHTEDIFHKLIVLSEFNAFNLQDFKIHFTILFLGYFITFITFVVETNQVKK